MIGRNRQLTSRRVPQRGFTLIELMTVVGMIAVLASVAAYKGPDPCRWSIKQASRDLFNTVVLLQSLARSQGRLTGLYMGSRTCQPNGGLDDWYSYDRGFTGGGRCSKIQLPRHVRIGLGNGIGSGPTIATQTHVADGDGVSFPLNRIQFDSRGFTVPVVNFGNDSVYVACDPAGGAGFSNLYARAIVIRPLGRPQLYEWSVGSGQWELLYDQ